MSQKRNLRLETGRLILREFNEDDWPAVHEYGSDPEVVRYMGWGPNTEQDTKEFVQKTLAHQKEKPRTAFQFALITRTEIRFIGACGLSIRNAENKQGEIGWVLNRHFWNQGYMTEAARKVIAFGFEQLGLHRVYATCDQANIGSYRVMEKIGMQKEGHLRENMLIKGRWRDSLLYSILEYESPKNKTE